MSIKSRLADSISPIASWWQGISARERVMLSVLLGLVVAALVLWPVFGYLSDVSQLSEENKTMQTLLERIDVNGKQLALRKKERQASESLYRSPAPSLAEFIEKIAKKNGYERSPDITESPDKEQGQYKRREVLAYLSNVGMRTFVNTLTDIKNSKHPVTIQRIDMTHPQPGKDRFSVKMSIVAYDKIKAAKAADETDEQSDKTKKDGDK